MATQEEARDAVFASIKLVADNLGKVGVSAGAPAVRDVAIAYRAVLGGEQPDGIRRGDAADGK